MKVLLFYLFVFLAFTCAEHSSHETKGLSQGSFPCKEDKECQKRYGVKSQCEQNFCSCYKGFEKIECSENLGNHDNQSAEGRSYEDFSDEDHVPFIGKSCTTEKDCHYLHAICNDTKQCDCQPDYTNTKDGKYCLKTVKNLGEPCKKEEQCTFKFGNSTCTNKKCECRENYHVSASQCWKDIGYGEKCDDSRECWHFYGYCAEENHTCVCAGKRVINSRKTMCLDIVNHRERCFETVQCTTSLGDADCVQGYCHCARNYHFVPFRQKCIPSKTLGQPCDEDEDCYQTSRNDDRNFLKCAHAKVCICSNGFERIGYQCVEKENGSSATTVYVSCLLLMTVLGFLFCL